MKKGFTVIDVFRFLGIPTEPKRTWAAGTSWRNEYRRVTGGEEGALVLTEKTDPNAKVKAKHGIRTYPAAWFDTACRFFKFNAEEERKQKDMFDD